MHKDLHRCRAAALSMILTSNRRSQSWLVKSCRNWERQIDGVAIRVPTRNVSLVDLKFVAKEQQPLKKSMQLLWLLQMGFEKIFSDIMTSRWSLWTLIMTKRSSIFLWKEPK